MAKGYPMPCYKLMILILFKTRSIIESNHLIIYTSDLHQAIDHK